MRITFLRFGWKRENLSRNLDSRQIEFSKSSAILSNLYLTQIPPDGNCLYNAIADQISLTQLKTKIKV